MPDPSDPDLLARLTEPRATGADPDAMRAVQCMQVRHTDRRPVSDEPVPDDSLSAIAAAAVQEGARLEVLDRDQVLQLAASASQAATVEAEDSRLREELEYWTSRAGGTGLTPEVLPEQPAQTTVPGRDFGRAGTLPVGPGHDRAASYAVLYGDQDEPVDWLRAGEALSAAWLAATRLGVSMVPAQRVVRCRPPGRPCASCSPGSATPYLGLRLGWPTRRTPAHRTPRDCRASRWWTPRRCPATPPDRAVPDTAPAASGVSARSVAG
ncbi:nitroreductase family protein [Verrucosispora sioxanthis]|uniref:nitroreductase family protein n=1 Tax=Verrucosispora sioxanthis TaxID=2499994 RepID=UPI0038B5F9F2